MEEQKVPVSSITKIFLATKKTELFGVGDLVVFDEIAYHRVSRFELGRKYGPYLMEKSWNPFYTVTEEEVLSGELVEVGLENLPYPKFIVYDPKSNHIEEKLKTHNLELLSINVQEGRSWIWFKTTCSCTDSDHTISMDLSYDGEMCEAGLTVKTEVADYFFHHQEYHRNDFIQYWYDLKHFYKTRIWRIKHAIQILLKGHIETSSTFSFKDENHVSEFADALIVGRDLIQ